MLFTRKLSLTGLTTEALESTRVALEVLHGERIRFLHLDIDPMGKGEDSRRTVDIEGAYTTSGRTNQISLSISLEMKKENCWTPDRAFISISHEQKFYSARWEERLSPDNVVLVAPSAHYDGVKFFFVGTSNTERWTESLYPKK